MLHVGMILGERYVTCRHDSRGFWGKELLHVDMILGKDMLHVGMILGERLLHVGMILGERAVTCRYVTCMILGERAVTCRHDSGGKICYM